jgi:hypothetical protein
VKPVREWRHIMAKDDKDHEELVQEVNKLAADLWKAKAEELKLKVQIAEVNARLAAAGAHHAVVVGW